MISTTLPASFVFAAASRAIEDYIVKIDGLNVTERERDLGGIRTANLGAFLRLRADAVLIRDLAKAAMDSLGDAHLVSLSGEDFQPIAKYWTDNGTPT